MHYAAAFFICAGMVGIVNDGGRLITMSFGLVNGLGRPVNGLGRREIFLNFEIREIWK
jgi:hypothetical protein